MSQIHVEVNEKDLQIAQEICTDAGIDILISIRMFLRRMVKEKSIAFLFSNALPTTSSILISENRETQNPAIAEKQETILPSTFRENLSDLKDMTKSRAIRLLIEHGFSVGKNVTFASKNRGAYNYWANPEFTLLDNDWNLILNDWINRKLYLFLIPKNSISKNELVSRTDKRYLIDLQIMYRDSTFTDNRSRFSFAKYLVGEIDY